MTREAYEILGAALAITALLILALWVLMMPDDGSKR